MIKINFYFLVGTWILLFTMIVIDISWFKQWFKKNKDNFIDKKNMKQFFLTAPIWRPFPELIFSNPKTILSQYFRFPDKINWMEFRIKWGILGNFTHLLFIFLVILTMVYLITGGTVTVHVRM